MTITSQSQFTAIKMLIELYKNIIIHKKIFSIGIVNYIFYYFLFFILEKLYKKNYQLIPLSHSVIFLQQRKIYFVKFAA